MKKFNFILLAMSLMLSNIAFSEGIPENLPFNIEVTQQESELISFRNLSNEKIIIDIYGEEIVLENNSGAIFNCTGYGFVEIQFKDTLHDYFEVACKSSITIKN